MRYRIRRTIEFKDQYQKLTRKNRPLEVRLDRKIAEIVRNPEEIGKPKRYALKYARGSHVDPYVIIYIIIGDVILFIYVDHHDFVYEEAPRVLGDIELQFPELWAAMPPGLRQKLKR